MTTSLTQAYGPPSDRHAGSSEAPCGGRDSPLAWSIRSHDRCVVITLTGEIDAYTAPRLEERITPIAETGNRLSLDVAGISFCGVTGLSLFVRLRDQATAVGGSLLLVAPTPTLRRLIRRTGLADVLAVCDTADDAPHTHPGSSDRPRSDRRHRRHDHSFRPRRPE